MREEADHDVNSWEECKGKTPYLVRKTGFSIWVKAHSKYRKVFWRQVICEEEGLYAYDRFHVRGRHFSIEHSMFNRFRTMEPFRDDNVENFTYRDGDCTVCR